MFLLVTVEVVHACSTSVNYGRFLSFVRFMCFFFQLTDAVWQCMEFSGTCKTLSLILDLLDVSEGQSGI